MSAEDNINNMTQERDNNNKGNDPQNFWSGTSESGLVVPESYKTDKIDKEHRLNRGEKEGSNPSNPEQSEREREIKQKVDQFVRLQQDIRDNWDDKTGNTERRVKRAELLKDPDINEAVDSASGIVRTIVDDEYATVESVKSNIEKELRHLDADGNKSPTKEITRQVLQKELENIAIRERLHKGELNLDDKDVRAFLESHFGNQIITNEVAEILFGDKKKSNQDTPPANTASSEGDGGNEKRYRNYRYALESGFIKQDELNAILSKETSRLTDAETAILRISRSIRLRNVGNKENWIKQEGELMGLIDQAYSQSAENAPALEDYLAPYLDRIEGKINELKDTPTQNAVDAKGAPGDYQRLQFEMLQAQKLKEEKEREAEKVKKQQNAIDDYNEFLQEERELANEWNLSRSKASDFHGGNPKYDIEGFDPIEKDEHKARVELRSAARKKSGVDLEGFGELEKQNNEYGGVDNKELEKLETVPGYVEARRKYMRYVKGNNSVSIVNQNGEEDTLRWEEIKDSPQLDRYRDGIVQEMISVVRQSERFKKKTRNLNEDSGKYQRILKEMATSAEQVAFNFLYSQNFFEAQQDRWSKNRDGSWVRTEVSGHKSKAIQPHIMAGMYPVDVMIENILKDDTEFSKKANSIVTNHAREWVLEEIKKMRISMKDLREELQEVVILPNEAKNENKFFTIERTRNNGYKLYLYSHIPRPVIKQLYTLDKIKFTKDENSPTMEDLMLDEDIDIVEWSKNTTSPKVFAETSEQAKKVNNYIQVVTSKFPLEHLTVGGGLKANEFAEAAKKAITEINFDGDPEQQASYKGELVRGMFHAAAKLDEGKRAPTLVYPIHLLSARANAAGLKNTRDVKENYPWEPEVKKRDGPIDKFLKKF